MLGQVALGVAVLANVTPDGWGVAIGQFGIAGVLGFILVKLEPRLKAIEDRTAEGLKTLEDRTAEGLKAIEDRVAEQLKGIQESNIVLAKSQLLVVVSLRQADEAHREQATHELKRINKRFPSKEPE